MGQFNDAAFNADTVEVEAVEHLPLDLLIVICIVALSKIIQHDLNYSPFAQILALVQWLSQRSSIGIYHHKKNNNKAMCNNQADFYDYKIEVTDE